MTADQLAGGGDARPLFILPIGSTEQHSNHLPVGTDSILVEAVARHVEQRFPTEVALLPTMRFGASDHHDGRAGTASVGSINLAHSIANIISSLARSTNIDRVLILNGHGGNVAAMTIALEIVAGTHPRLHAYSLSYWNAMFDELSRRGTPHPAPMGHADHVETSMMLALDPSLVDMTIAEADGPVDNHPEWLGFSTKFHVRTIHGGVGDPTAASANEGTQFLAAATDAIVALIGQM